jgi:DNA-binding CsgD family transcriptional regulator
MMTREEIILKMIEGAIERGEPCPSNASMACAIDAGSISQPPVVLNRLVDRGIISIERFQRSRVVTIIATGRSTARSTDKAHTQQQAGAVARRNQLAELVAEGSLLKDAARAMGISEPRVWQLWRDIKGGLGQQARRSGERCGPD